MVIKTDLQEIEKAIFGTTTRDFSNKTFKDWKNNAITQIKKIKNGWDFDEYMLEDIINYLTNIDFVDDTKYELNNNIISLEELRQMFIFVYGLEKNSNVDREKLENFYEDILRDNISVYVCNSEDEAIFKIFIDNCDNKELIDNVKYLLMKIETKANYNWEKAENILKIGERYFIINW